MVIINLMGLKKKIPLTKKDINLLVSTFHIITNKKIDLDLPLTINCVLVSKEKIIQLNEKWRKKKQLSAILAFPDYYLKQKKEPVQEEVHLGDLIISPEAIRIKAKENFKVSNLESFRLQFIYSFIHSLAHLYGYTHDSLRKAVEMEKIEKRARTIIIKKLIRS